MPDTPPVKTPAGVAVDGEAVRKLRQRLGHTITALAPLVKVSIGYLSQIERGHRPTVSPATFKRLAAALGLDEDPEQIEAKQRPAQARKVAA